MDTVIAREPLLSRILRELDEEPLPRTELGPDGSAVPLASRTSTASLALASVTAASLLAARATDPAARTLPDPLRVALAFTSERHLRVDGRPVAGWAPLSGFFAASDGWVRTHGNYPHHAAALRRGLGLAEDADRDAAAQALARLPLHEAARRIDAAGGLCVAVAEEDPAADAALRATPLLDVARVGEGAPRRRPPAAASTPLRGIRVLDLTRVIAGPVATRTLALLGAEVLRIDPPALLEPEWQHLDTGHGKRSALLDLRRSPDQGARLLADADVVVTGYRSAALARLGLDPQTLAERAPGIVVARLSAWGFGRADAERRGFDSLVQAASGIAWVESTDGTTPGALPAQALDHSAGYLLAGAVLSLLRRQAEEGGTWRVETSLRRIAAELLGMPRRTEIPTLAPLDPTGHQQTFDLDGLPVTTVAPALVLPAGPLHFAAPHRWGRDRAEWR